MSSKASIHPTISVVTEAERVDNLLDNELEEPDDDKPSSLFPTVTQGRSVRVQKPRDLSYLNRFWDD